MMPVLDGLELCQALKANPATASIPVVLMSAAAPQVATGAGADGFIRKPFDLSALDALVRMLISAPE
jgi:CheY-like chemotaxis protein